MASKSGAVDLKAQADYLVMLDKVKKEHPGFRSVYHSGDPDFAGLRRELMQPTKLPAEDVLKQRVQNGSSLSVYCEDDSFQHLPPTSTDGPTATRKRTVSVDPTDGGRQLRGRFVSDSHSPTLGRATSDPVVAHIQ